MYETVKVVKGYRVERMVGTRGFFRVYISSNKFCTFRTIKSAVEFIESTL